jgi:hypothetical protein
MRWCFFNTIIAVSWGQYSVDIDSMHSLAPLRRLIAGSPCPYTLPKRTALLRAAVLLFAVVHTTGLAAQSEFQRLGAEIAVSDAVERSVSVSFSEATALVTGMSGRDPEVMARFVRELSSSTIAGTARAEALLLRLVTEARARYASDELPAPLAEALASGLNDYRDGTLRRIVLEGIASHPAPAYGAVLAERGAHIAAALEGSRQPEPPELRREAEAYLRAIEAHGRPELAIYGARIGESSRYRPTVSLAKQVARSLLQQPDR